MSYSEIADKLNTTVMTVTRRVKQMKKTETIKKFTVVVDPDTVGRNYGICFLIQLDCPSAINEVSAALSNCRNLCYVHHITGEFEIAAMARCKDKEDASELIKWVSSVRCVVRVIPHSVLKTIKEDLDIDLG
jgi:Lrp/AsnC family transcriptional regulator for asnA, asnC and gidA